MEVGIVGKQGVGKTTLFNALTGLGVPIFGEKAHIGIASIPDPRLPTIAGFIPTKKIIEASLKLVDIPGLPAGSDSSKLNSFLEQIRQVDALVHVARCFDDGSGVIDPAGDVAAMETDLGLADFVVAESAKDRATRTARSGDAEAKARVTLLERITAELEEGTAIRDVEWSDEQKRLLGNYGFVTAKPVLYVANVGEDDVDGSSAQATSLAEHAKSQGSQSVAVCASLEAELAELDADDRDEMLESLGLKESAIGPLARKAQAVLGLTTFYTAGPKEVRAWTIPIDAPATSAAGVIHSDIERGFIRAECYSIDDLVELKNEKAIREAGRMRSEGKSYAMQDGDLVNFLFNV